MGSTNTGRFTDYSQNSKGSPKTGGIGGGASGDDLCDKAFTTELEEVERCEYFKKYSKLPNKGSQIYVNFNNRLEIISNSSEVIGYLPTKYNYLVACTTDGFSYAGVIVSTTITPLVKIRVDIAPE